MLIIKAPIQLKCTKLPLFSYEVFRDRIAGNYSITHTPMKGEDLLHVTMQPPEFFVSENSESFITNITSNIQTQETKLDILSQFLNRITAVQEVNLTYQDRVFITGVLNKLGINNVSYFMKQVALLKEEANSTSELISLYWSHFSELKQMVSEYKENVDNKEVFMQEEKGANQSFLYQRIFNRLKTGAIYQIIHNFTRNQSLGDSYINNDELRITEQSKMSQNLLLNTLKNDVRGEFLPLAYQSSNYYETASIESTGAYAEKEIQNLTAAMLLQITDNVYRSKLSRDYHFMNCWINLKDAFYKISENTMNRIFMNHTEKEDFLGESNYLVNENNRSNRQEINLITRLFDKEISYDNSERHNTFNSIYEIDGIAKVNRNSIHHHKQMNYEIQQSDNQNDYTEIQYKNESIESGSILQSLQEIQQKNIENESTYVKFMKQLTARKEQPTRDQTVKRTRQDSMEALNNQNEVMFRLKEEAKQEKKNADSEFLKTMMILPEETRRIYEIVDQYHKNPERIQQSVKVGSNQIGTLMNDINEMEKTRISRTKIHSSETEYTHLVSEENEGYQEIHDEILKEYISLPQSLKHFVEEQKQDSIEVRTKQELKHLLAHQDMVSDLHIDKKSDLTNYIDVKTRENANIQRTYATEKEVSEVDRVSMVYKVEQKNLLDEEVVELLLQQNKNHENKITSIEQVTHNSKTVERNVNQHVTRDILRQNEDINELVQRGVQRQIADISDQVYVKLENRLQNERRRRGY